MNLPVCRRLLYYLSGKGLRPRTVHGYFDPVDGLCKFLLENGLLTETPVSALTLPKKDAALRLTVSNEEIAGLFAAVERYRNPRRQALNHAALNVLIFGGLRRAEVCGLHLAAADVGIVMGIQGSDTAMETADITLMRDDLGRLACAIRLSRRTRAIIRQNVVFALLTKGLLLITACAAGVPLWLAVLSDAGVSLVVTLNALRLMERGRTENTRRKRRAHYSETGLAAQAEQ